MLELRNLKKDYGSVSAVNDVSLTIQPGEMFSLLGGSGCGKSTLLRMIAGLELPTAGGIFVDGVDITGTAPYERPVNLMFQSYALFPHLTVRGNIEFGIRRERLPAAEIARRTGEMLDLLKLHQLADRKPHQLSGGQQQRVALARCLAKRPRLLLLDEPLSALDRKLREHTQAELRRIQAAVGITFVIVTHDQQEALSLSSRLAIMEGGRVIQMGTPQEIYARPASRTVADFIGHANFLEATIGASTDEGSPLRRSCGTLIGYAAADRQLGSGAMVAIRPDLIELLPRVGDQQAASAETTGVAGKVTEILYQGAMSLIVVAAHDDLVLKVQYATSRSWRPSVGDSVFARWNPRAVWLLDDHARA
jgi:putrescine transport system ATP-binding protein